MASTASSKAGAKRAVITVDALEVAPVLLGLPLAGPWRRAMAIAIDGFIVLILSLAPGFLLAIAGALVVFRISVGKKEEGFLRRSGKFLARFFAAAIFFVAVMFAWSAWSSRGSENEELADLELGEGGGITLNSLSSLQSLDDIIDFREASDAEEATAAAEELAEEMREVGVEQAEIRAMILELAEDPERPWLLEGANVYLSGGAPLAVIELPDPDTAFADYAAALEAGDTTRAHELRQVLAQAFAADTLQELNEELEEERGENTELASRLAETEADLEGRGIVAFARTFLEDLGLGLGWSGLYFTALTVFGRGRTPGKRLLRTRVIRLDGERIGWWTAFERFGGYAAGFATGLLGFFQILWDPNRQAVHDKIAATVVVRE
jgi:hypothetical protein